MGYAKYTIAIAIQIYKRVWEGGGGSIYTKADVIFRRWVVAGPHVGLPWWSRQHVSAAVEAQPRRRGNPKFSLPAETMSLEESTPKCAQVIMLLISTRVRKMVVITQPLFPPWLCENANSFPSFPFLSFLWPYFILAHVQRPNASTEFNA